MGLSLSPLMGNIYLEYFKLIATGMYPLKSPIQYRYVDDMFILWSHQENKQALIKCEANKTFKTVYNGKRN